MREDAALRCRTVICLWSLPRRITLTLTLCPNPPPSRRTLLALASSREGGHPELEGVVVRDVTRSAVGSLGLVATVLVQTQVRGRGRVGVDGVPHK